VAPAANRLTTYRQKRDFARTPEPRGRSAKERKQPRFVVQRHDASSLHYDFRLEAGGVLKSWAVPKGPPRRAQDKRLAMPTEDHPIDYLTFEGEIPEGEYGAGTVEVWDVGTYENRTEKNGKPVAMARALSSGHVVIDMHGEKLKGGFALTRIGDGKRPRWLLVKTKKKR
jgi:DNA ligase D-like protein (predicted 3'-phosphoesterase)